MVVGASCLSAAQANWLTKILKEAGEVGSDAGRHGRKLSRAGLGALDAPANVIRKIPERSDRFVVGVHATQEGHWKFVNQKGDVYTAGTPDELARFESAIAPDGLASNNKLALYLSEDTLFDRTGMLKELPSRGELHLVSGKASYRLLPSGSAVRTPGQLAVEVRPKVRVLAPDRAGFQEALWQLSRPLVKADMRVLALEPGASATLSPRPRFDKVRKVAMVDQVDPDGLASALSGVRGQTVLVTGRVEGGSLFYPASGLSEGSLSIKALREAAAKADVNLVLMRSSTTRQPGGRNWFWQRVEVEGLEDALKRATFADFLDAMGAGRGTYRVTVKNEGVDRIHLEAVPERISSVPFTESVGQWLEDFAASVTGDLAISAMSANLRSKDRQTELDARLIPGIPSDYQIAYVVSLVFGLMGWSIAAEWWRMMWRRDEPEEYRSLFGYYAGRVVEWLLYLFVYLPIVGIPAFVVTIFAQLLTIILMPYWFFRWLFRLVVRRT